LKISEPEACYTEQSNIGDYNDNVNDWKFTLTTVNLHDMRNLKAWQSTCHYQLLQFVSLHACEDAPSLTYMKSTLSRL